MKILFISKPNSDNFIRNYSNHVGELLVTREANEVWKADRSGKYTHLVFEWGNDFTALCVAKKLQSKVVVRVHDHEVRKNRIDAINWNHVDSVWFINKEIQRQFLLRYKKPSFWLPNAVDITPFKEERSEGKHIGLLTIYARSRKRLDRAIELMKLIPEWTLTIRCEKWNPEVSDSVLWIRKLEKSAPPNVRFDWRQASFVNRGYEKDDVNKFFKDKSVVLSTSEHEAFHYTIAEGALCGCLPVVFNWEFGEARDFWKPFVCDSIEEMAKDIIAYEPSSYYRNYAEQYSPASLIPLLKAQLEKVEKS